MAIENAKVLNTRIILKNDSLEKWNGSSLILQKGEIGLAEIASADNYSAPTYLIKVGDGTNTFANLKWVAANAADVYKWAKSKDIKTDGTGNAVTGVSIIDNADGTTSVVLNKEVTFALASDLDNYTTTENLNALLDEYITDEELTTILANYAEKEHTHTVSEITDFDDKVKEYDYATKTEAQGYANAKDEAIAAAKKAGDDAQAEVDALEKVVATKANTADVYAKTETYSATEIDNKLSGLDVGTLGGRIDDVEADIEILKGDADTDGSVAKALADAKAYTDEVKNDILGEGISDTFDTLVEIQNWINGDGVDATELTSAIAGEAGIREEADLALDGRITKLENNEAGYATTGYVDEAKAEAKEHAGELNTAMDSRVKILEAINHDAYVAADETVLASAKSYAEEKASEAQTAAENKVTELANGAVATNTSDIEGIKSTINSYGDIVTHDADEFATVEDVNAKANDADLAAIAKTGSTDDLVQGTLVLVFDCGTSDIQ